MDGLTSTQIRAATVTALQASASVLALVDSGSIYNSRLTPVELGEGAVATVWIGDEDENPAANYPSGMLAMACESDCVVQFQVPEVDGEVESQIDGAETLKEALLSSVTWMSLWDNGPPSVRSRRWRSTDGDRFYGCGELIFTVRHIRGY